MTSLTSLVALKAQLQHRLQLQDEELQQNQSLADQQHRHVQQLQVELEKQQKSCAQLEAKVAAGKDCEMSMEERSTTLQDALQAKQAQLEGIIKSMTLAVNTVRETCS